VQNGPAMRVPSSTTRKPASGPEVEGTLDCMARW
jgi:hypothetical protein